MSQPTYPIFSKNYQRFERLYKYKRPYQDWENVRDNGDNGNNWDNRNNRNKQNSTKSTYIESYRGRYNFVKSETKSEVESWFNERKADFIQKETCNICKKNIINRATISTCNHSFCEACLEVYSLCFNRCYTCNKVIDLLLYETYDGLNLNIPTYDEFVYNE